MGRLEEIPGTARLRGAVADEQDEHDDVHHHGESDAAVDEPSRERSNCKDFEVEQQDRDLDERQSKGGKDSVGKQDLQQDVEVSAHARPLLRRTRQYLKVGGIIGR